MLFDLFKAVILGVVEGLTEFLPCPSTGHLLLVDHFFGPEPEKKAFWDSFAVLIQFGRDPRAADDLFHKAVEDRARHVHQ